MKYYLKELVNNRLYLKSGAQAPFEPHGSIGILAIDDAGIIDELDALIKQRRGGVSAIEADKFEELKKNPPDKTSPKRWFAPVRAVRPPQRPQPPSQPVSAAVAEVKPEGDQHPALTIKPRKVPVVPVQTDPLRVAEIPAPVKALPTVKWNRLKTAASPEASTTNQTPDAVLA